VCLSRALLFFQKLEQILDSNLRSGLPQIFEVDLFP